MPAQACLAGSRLAAVRGTVCSVCYALKDKYCLPKVRLAQARRLTSLDGPLWVEAMARVLNHVHRAGLIRVTLGIVNAKARGIQRWRWNMAGWHRWHDSGDLQSVKHFAMICEVARLTPSIRHWLPTTELRFVRAYMDGGGAIPDNLVVRVSSVRTDDDRRRAWPQTSSVVNLHPAPDGYLCPAPEQNHECRSCRACWRADVAHVTYRMH